ncbi:MAG TPA: sulfate/molybdate ABC transporter ATP-binding protein [Candidatus Acidoferrales bacterium]|nr:sulfate/molybdate ABC transporter ATP-binding protein [Candidatus Acidoferrales bacterium]
MALQVDIEKRLAGFTLDLSFAADDVPLGILGPSGSGKTMLLRCIAGLEDPTHGRIVLGNHTLLDTEHDVRVPARRRRVGMLFQHYALFPHQSVAENVGFGLGQLPRAERDRRVRFMLNQVHAAELEPRYPRQLSGGEQQRVALARALASEPEALLLDEPLSALDTHLRSQMEAQLQETFLSYRGPALLVTHNIEEAYRLSARLLVLSRGRIAAMGPREEIFRRPPSVEVALLTGCKNISQARAVSDRSVEAVDWGCRLRLAQAVPPSVGHIGIRAHHIDFTEYSDRDPGAENVFPCWLVSTSETPFRITLYLRLHKPPDESGGHDLQAEVFKQKWEKFSARPLPWHVELSPESLFVMPK